ILRVVARHGDDLASRQAARHAGRLRPPGREGVVYEGRGALYHGARAAVVLEAALLHQGDAGGRVDAGTDVLDEVGAFDRHVVSAVVEDKAGYAILAEAAAIPFQAARHAAAGAVGKARATLGVAVHPRVEHGTLDVADDVEADAAHMLDIDVVDAEVVDRAVGAVGDDLDAVALAAVAHDREVRQRELAHIDAGRNADLDDRLAVGDVRVDLGAAEVDAALGRTGDVDDDGRADRVAVGIAQMGDIAAGKARLEPAFDGARSAAGRHRRRRRRGHGRKRGRRDAAAADRNVRQVTAADAARGHARTGDEMAAVAGNERAAIALQVGEGGGVGARACIGAGTARHGGVAGEIVIDAGGLHTRGREGVVVEVAVALEPDAAAVVVDEGAVGHRGDAVFGADAVTGIAAEGGTVDAHVACAVGQHEAGAAVVVGAAAEPAQRTHLAAVGAVREIRTA